MATTDMAVTGTIEYCWHQGFSLLATVRAVKRDHAVEITTGYVQREFARISWREFLR